MAILNPKDPACLRAHYEEQGHQALRTGTGIRCSEPTVTRAVLDLILPHAQGLRRVLDVGCGANLDYDLVLADRGIDVVGIDFAESFLALAPRHEHITLLQGDATNLPFSGEQFDAVICSETVEHVPDDAAVLREIARVLVPGGLLVFTVPLLWNLARIIEMIKQRSMRITMMEGHLREYRWSQAFELVETQFTVERVQPVPFGWSGRFGGPLDWLITAGLLSRYSKSFAALARSRK